MYCPTRECGHYWGVSVPWAPDSLSGPAYPLWDTCPKCGTDLLDEIAPDEDEEEEAA
jgi:rRNA maturation protein Nop10